MDQGQRERAAAAAEAEERGEAREEEALGLADLDPAQVVRAAAELAREHPHTAVAGAFALGFLLGGGLTPRLLVSLATVVGRRYAAGAARGLLADLVEREIDEARAGSA